MPELPAQRRTDIQEHDRARRALSWTAVAAEVVLASAAILLDLAIPTLVLVAMAGVSLLIRKEGMASLGLERVTHRGLAVKMLVFTVAWSLVH